MKITVLAENNCFDGSYATEHGLSLFVQTEETTFLFDMGQTDLFVKNAKKLGIDLNTVDFAVLSHGHYDHGGGLEHFLKLNSHAPVYLSKNAFGEYYNGTEKYIGLNQKLQHHSRLIQTEDIDRIDEQISLFSCNQKERCYSVPPHGLTMKQEGEYLSDLFLHEQYLLIETKGKRVLFSGCSHKGILNIVNWFQPDVLIGGFHFSKLPLNEILRDYAKQLNAYSTEFYTCHCTGYEQYEFMKQEMKHLHYLCTGDCIII